MKPFEGDEVFRVDVPLLVRIPRKTMEDKKATLNMNEFIGWCYRQRSVNKAQYYEDNKHLFEGVKIDGPVDVQFRLYKRQYNLVDKSNFFALVSKFVYDVMTKCEVWPDDNDDQIINECLLQTVTDPENPRAELIFTRATVAPDPARWKHEFFKNNKVNPQKDMLVAAGASECEVRNDGLRKQAYDKYLYNK